MLGRVSPGERCWVWLLAYWCEEARVARRRRGAAPKGEVGCGTLVGGEARAVGTGTKGWDELALYFGTGAGALNIERAGGGGVRVR